MVEQNRSLFKSNTTVQLKEGHIHNGRTDAQSYFIHCAKTKIIEAFLNLGMKENKSEINFPKLPTKLVPHFIRRFFKGKGSFSLVNNYLRTSLRFRSLSFIRDLKEVLFKADLPKRNINVLGANKNSYKIDYAHKDSCVFLEYLFKESTIETRYPEQYQMCKEVY